MKKTKIVSLFAVSALSVAMLAACGNNNSTKTSSSDAKTTQSAKTMDVFAGATKGTDSFADLQKGFAKNGAWLNATKGDMDASGKTLTVEGLFLGDNAVARKLAIYNQDSNFKITARYTLTVGKIEVKSPGFYISNGTVKGNVDVFAAGFHGQTGQGVAGQATIDGNLTFASQALLDAYNKLPDAQKVKVTGTTSVVKGDVVSYGAGAIKAAEHGNVTYLFKGNGSDTQTGATTGTADAATFTSGLGKNGAWLVAANKDIDASGKDITVDGIFLNEAGMVQRTLALATTNQTHQITGTFTLTVGRLIVNSPATDFEGGNVKGDVYVGKDGSLQSRGMKTPAGTVSESMITGNLYFATQKQLDAYKALPAANQFKVSGTVGVKTAD
ncbi:hypothetical protein GHI93_09165 [Lactococcus hircilactis]|uniref:Lipoprotein n=1 Tax=Lactococcus hircilactis TaxID=1494462 RepID=A0A7X1ZBK1_9LACT|nr:hypothetical protein [Lactococcus hircilactis]MQW40095.1 hypothetical protein [Lactococcus hircilactis]